MELAVILFDASMELEKDSLLKSMIREWIGMRSLPIVFLLW